MNQFKKTILFLFCLSVLVLKAQNEESGVKAYGFEITALGIPKQAPNGYHSILTVQLNKPLYPEKSYEVGFWIFGKQLRDQGYSYPINVFPSNSIDHVETEVFDLVKANDSLPLLKIDPPPIYKTKGHFTFNIQPDTVYNQITIALKVDSREQLPINLPEDVTVIKVFVRPLPDIKKERNKEEEVKNENSKTIAKRKLIDSKKSYIVSEKELIIGLYDHRNIDKDRVTIYLNNDIIIENLELKKKKQFYTAVLKPGTNTITLHAENLGEVAPNTAAIIIKNKSQEFMAVLASDLGQSQYFTLIYKPN